MFIRAFYHFFLTVINIIQRIGKDNLMDSLFITDITELREPNRYGIVHPSKAFRMLSRIVIDVTYQCSLACPNCNRLCGISPRNNAVNLETIRQFVAASIAMKKHWAHIYISGGEPALHPEIETIFTILQEYIDFHKINFGSKLLVKYFTNSHTERANQVLASLPEDYIVINSHKKDSNRSFKPMCVAPIDVDFYDDDNLRPCQELYQCGMTLNHRGYYPCAPAAAIDNVLLGGRFAITNLEEVTFEQMADILHQTCRYCGHYFEPIGYRRETRLMVSQTWKDFIEEGHTPALAAKKKWGEHA